MDKNTINQMALMEAEKSECKKRKVGAIIVNADETKVIAKGHNYVKADSPDMVVNGDNPCEDAHGNTIPQVVHAEVAAIEKLKNKVKGGKIYVTHYPCENCQKAIKEAELEIVIVESFMKFDTGKLRYGLIPPEATKALAEVLTYGAKKYKPNNWQQVDDTNRYIDALYRHLEAWRSGEKVDPESGLHHLAHALTNVSFLLYFETSKS